MCEDEGGGAAAKGIQNGSSQLQYKLPCHGSDLRRWHALSFRQRYLTPCRINGPEPAISFADPTADGSGIPVVACHFTLYSAAVPMRIYAKQRCHSPGAQQQESVTMDFSQMR